MPASATDRIDGLTTSIAVKPPCVAATTAAITLSGLQTVNGVTLASGDRVLVKDQTDHRDNGIYVVSTSAWQRARDFDGARDAVPGTLVVVESSGSDVLYKTICADNPVAFGTSSITFSLAAFGDATSVSFTQTGTGAVARSVQTKLRDWVSVKDFGAVGDGVTNDTTKIQAALDSLTSGGICYFPRGDYLISAGLRPSAGATLMGDGYGSRILVASGGWTLSSPTNFGLINIYNVNHVRVTNLRLYGTTAAAQGTSPKLVFLDTCTGVSIDGCWLENSAWEGIWCGGTETACKEIRVVNNDVNQVGAPAGSFVGLGSITLNATDFVVGHNRFTSCGIAISAAGTRGTVVGNQIHDFTLIGIATGDSSEDGTISIVGNSISFSSDPSVARVGIFCEGSADASTENWVVVSGNVVRMTGNASYTNAVCYRQTTGRYVHFSGNVAEINVRGVGFEAAGFASFTPVVVFQGNTVYVTAESGSSSAFVAATSSGQTLTVRSINNQVFGVTRANSSYAYDYNQNGGGTITCSMAGDMTTGGSVRNGTINYSAAETDNVPIFENVAANTDWHRAPYLTGTAFSALGTPGNGTIVFCYDGTTGSNPLTSGGTGCLAVRQNGAWKGL